MYAELAKLGAVDKLSELDKLCNLTNFSRSSFKLLRREFPGANLIKKFYSQFTQSMVSYTLLD